MTYILMLGMGYSAFETAAHLKTRGWTIAGTGRSQASLDKIAAHGFEAIAFDGAAPSGQLAKAIAAATHILVSIPPDNSGDPAVTSCGPLIVRSEKLRWIGYLSTIGVYGDHNGAWVDEDTPVNPQSNRSRARVLAEKEWIGIATVPNVPIDIMRLAGIYGPGRSPVERLMRGDGHRIVKPGQVFNRIHVADIAHTVTAAIDTAEEGAHTVRIFNVTDDEPAPPQDVVGFAAELLGAALPPATPYDEADLSPMARSFYMENKRVGNDRIKQSLGVALRYPTYREGISALAAVKKGG